MSTLQYYFFPLSLVFMAIFSSIYFRWQARREQDRNMRAGLIPSRALQERRIVHERNEQNGETSDKQEGTLLWLGY